MVKWLKFIYSEKATKFCEISTLLLSACTVDKSKVEISQNFVAFSEYTNFKRQKMLGFRYKKYRVTLVLSQFYSWIQESYLHLMAENNWDGQQFAILSKNSTLQWFYERKPAEVGGIQ